jgi:hypothetical protein
MNAAGTGITEIQFGQTSEWNLITTNPVPRMYAFLWTPSSYAARAVTFGVSMHTPPFGASVTVAIGALRASIFVDPTNVHLGSVTIPVVPAPAVAVLLATAAPLGRRRRTQVEDFS